MRLCPYLCGMKTIKLITLTAFFFCLNMPLYAQFNTVGTINNKRIYTTNPPKPKEALTDSMVVVGSVPDSTTTGNNVDRQAIVTSSNNNNLMSLVALPLENIYINSGSIRDSVCDGIPSITNGSCTMASTFPLDTKRSIRYFLVLSSKWDRIAGLGSS